MVAITAALQEIKRTKPEQHGAPSTTSQTESQQLTQETVQQPVRDTAFEQEFMSGLKTVGR